MPPDSPVTRREFDYLERRVTQLEAAEVAVLANEVAHHGREIESLRESFKTFTRALVIATLTVATSAIFTSLTFILTR